MNRCEFIGGAALCAAAGLWIGGAFAAAGAELIPQDVLRSRVDVLKERFFDSRTEMLYDVMWECPNGASAVAALPTAEEISRQWPNPCAWGVGMQDCVFNGAPFLLTAIAVDDWKTVRAAYRGLRCCAKVSGVPGFVARGVLPTDGKSFYINSSRDVYTLFVYALWRLYRHPETDAAWRKEIRELLVDVAKYAEKCVVPANDYELLRADGRRGIVCKMWMFDPMAGGLQAHEALRLPMFYAAVYAVSGDRHWREMELKYADDGIRIAGRPLMTDIRGSILGQMQLSQRLLWECETDPERKARYAELLRRCADEAERGVVPRMARKASKDGWFLRKPLKDWRQCPIAPGSMTVGGYVYGVPDHPAPVIEEPFVELSHAILVQHLAVGRPVSAESVKLFKSVLADIDFKRAVCANAVNALLAAACVNCYDPVGDEGATTKPLMIVAPTVSREHPAQVFRREIVCTGAVTRATLSITGLGVYEARLNGCRIGKEELAPGCSSDRMRQQSVHDVRALLKEGTNVLDVTTAESYWRDALVTAQPARHPIGFSATLDLTDAAGSRTIGPDDSWLVSDRGPLVGATIYDGETYDARRERISDWQRAVVTNLDLRTVPARGRIYVRRDCIAVAKVPFEVRPGERKVVDFGQNCAGREAFAVRGPCGATVTVRHAEVLNPDGSCYFDNLRKAQATTRYTLKGEGLETYVPRFTYYGFRYVEISSDRPVVFEALRQEPLSSVTESGETGSIRTSDPDVNKIVSCAEWSLRSNQVSVPTDCAQRDERQAWIGDALTAVPATCWLWDARDFYAKSLRDQRDVQKADGRYSAIAPGNPSWMTDARYGAVGWADTGILMPYAVWRHFGDTSELAGHYDSMIRYADWLVRSGGPSAYGWGDWLAFHRTGFGWPLFPYASDPDTFAFLVHAYRIMDFRALSEMAAKLGRAADAKRFGTETEKALVKARAVLFGSGGGLDPKYASQTTMAIALAIGLCPDESSRQRTVEELVRSIENAGRRLMTGILGTSFLMNALSDNGHAELAYDLLLNRACPSWLYMVDRGATTLWEHWDGILSDGRFFSPTMNSFNHAEFASVLDWMYRTMAGIRPNPKDGGFDDFILQPQPDGRIRTVEADYRTPRGVIHIRSHYDNDGKWSYDYKLPPGTSATLILPGKSPVRIRAK